jgi:hypothetical protein
MILGRGLEVCGSGGMGDGNEELDQENVNGWEMENRNMMLKGQK